MSTTVPSKNTIRPDSSRTAREITYCGAGVGINLSRTVTLDVAYSYQKTTQSSYWLYYAILDATAALMLAPIWYALYYGSTFLARTHPDATKIAIGIKALGWISQFYGHGVHEGRAPALLDNMSGAVVLAPFFVWLEVIFHAGYRPQLQKELKNEVGKMVTQFRTKRAQVKRGKAN